MMDLLQKIGDAKIGGLVGWPTCSARDWKDTPGMSETGVNPDGTERTRLDQLPRVANLHRGRLHERRTRRVPGCVTAGEWRTR